MTNKLKVLALDIEGGYGGSSRSLFEAVRAMDRSAVDIEIWCKREGPTQERYRAIAVKTRVMPAMPKMSSLPKLSRNLWQLAGYLLAFGRAQTFLRDLRQVSDRVDVVHLNHEGLYLLGCWLKKRTNAAITSHFRTMPVATLFARWQARVMFASTVSRAYITNNERDLWQGYAGQIQTSEQDRVIFNPIEPGRQSRPHPAIALDHRLRVACLSNCSWARGTDRLLDIAAALQDKKRNDILFVVAGDQHLRGAWPGDLGAIAAAGGTLEDAARQRGLSAYFQFLGHVKEPESVLAASDLLIKPTRENNPWGRDILEALAAGLPVISIGRDDTFVETDVTGILFETFDRDAVAKALTAFADDRERLMRLGKAAQQRALALCDAKRSGAALLDLWRQAAAGKDQFRR